MDLKQRKTALHRHTRAPAGSAESAQTMAGGNTRHCPYCYETIALHARKCWRCHEYFSPPREDLDDRVLQIARREVLHDVVVDIKKWITRIGLGSVIGLLLVSLLGTLRLQDVLETMIADRVDVTMSPVLEDTEQQLDQSSQVLDDVQDSIRLAQHRFEQFDRLDAKLDSTETAVAKVEQARQSLESRAGNLIDQFEQLENQFLNAKRELRNDRERRLEEMLGNFSKRVVTYDKLYNLFDDAAIPQREQLLDKLESLSLRRISLLHPFTLAGDQPTVVFSPSVQLQWQFEGYDLGQVTYRVYYDSQPGFDSSRSEQGATRLAKIPLPPDFPHGPVYWRVEAVDQEGRVLATSDVGYFEFYENSIDRIRSTGAIRIGVACSTEGEFAFFDDKGNLTGYDVELSRWLASRIFPELPVRPVFLGYNWNQLLSSVRHNEVDFIISAITITPDREQEYGIKFTRPYYKTYQAAVVLRDSGIRTAAQLQGRRIAVQEGTTSETVGEAFTQPDNLHRVTSSEVAFDELLRRQVDAVIMDYDFARSQLRTMRMPASVISLKEGDFPPSYNGVRSEQYGIAVARSEEALLERLDIAIQQAEEQSVLYDLKQQFVTGQKRSPIARRLPVPRPAVPRLQY